MPDASDKLIETLIDLRERFPEIVFAYWERDEFDGRTFDEQNNAVPLTDEQWEDIREDFAERAYDAVANAEQISYAVEAAVKNTTPIGA